MKVIRTIEKSDVVEGLKSFALRFTTHTNFKTETGGCAYTSTGGNPTSIDHEVHCIAGQFLVECVGEAPPREVASYVGGEGFDKWCEKMGVAFEPAALWLLTSAQKSADSMCSWGEVVGLLAAQDLL